MILEELCWDVLKTAHGQTVTMSQKLLDKEPTETRIENGVAIGNLKKELVLHYTKNEIEDSLYFLEHRGYLLQHGYGVRRPMLVYSLSEHALSALENGSFPEEEQEAFSQALFDVKKPGWLGMNVNLGEAWRRAKKRREKKKATDS